MPTMLLRLRDSPHIELDGGHRLLLKSRDAALLAWLAIEGPTSRERLGQLLWPASTPTRQRNALRQRVFGLRHSLGFDAAVGSLTLELAPDLRYEPAADGDLLPAGAPPDAPELTAWLEQQRAAARRRDAQALDLRAQALESAGQPLEALVVAAQWLAREPLAEAAHRRMMRLHYLLGNRAAALAAFDRCEAMLKHELSTTPGAETRALLASIEQSPSPGAPGAPRTLPACMVRPPVMVGRSAALRALEQAWQLGQVATVRGEAGMGKSRLLAEFAARHPNGVTTAARPGDAGVPFGSLARWLRAVLGTHPGAPQDPAIRSALGGLLPEFAGPEAPARAGRPVPWSQAVAALLSGLQGLNGLEGLLFDDLQFADEASLELLGLLLGDDSLTGLRWVLAWRPAEAGSALRGICSGLADRTRQVDVPLAPLGADALAELLGQLGMAPDAAAMAQPLLHHTGGNPLFALETLKQLWIERGDAPPGSPVELPRPASVAAAIDRRLSRLSPPALALARVASVAGSDFSVALAEAVLATHAVNLADPFAELAAAQVLRDAAFAHDLLLDAVLRGLPAVVAQHLHGRVANWLQAAGGEPARIARHWVDAAEPEKAVPWLQQAAARAGAALRNRERMAFLDEQADIEEALGRQAQAFANRLAALAEYEQVLDSGSEVEARCSALERIAVSDEQRVSLWLMRSSLAVHRRETEDSIRWVKRALACAEQAGLEALVREGQLQLFEALTVAYRLDEARALGESCLAWVDHIDSEVRRLSFHGHMGLLYDNLGLLGKAMAQHDRARCLAHARRDDVNIAVVLSNQANNRAQSGRLQHAAAMRRESLALTEHIESMSQHQGVTLTNLAGALVMLGDYTQALALCDRAEALVAQCAPNGLPLVWAHRALAWIHLGQFARAGQAIARMAAEPGAVLPARVRHRLLAYRLSAAQGHPSAAELDACAALMSGSTLFGLQLTVRTEQALYRAPAEALALLDDLRAEAQARELGGQLLEIHLRTAQIALELDHARACLHAGVALALLQDFDLVSIYRGELWLQAARAQIAAGQEADARQSLHDGMVWLQDTERMRVPEVFRFGYRHQNAINVALRGLAARQGVADG